MNLFRESHVLIAAAALLLAGCSGSSEQPTATADEPGPGSQPPGSAAPSSVPEPGPGFLAADEAAAGLTKLLDAAGTEQFRTLGLGAEEMYIMTSADPSATQSAATLWRLAANSGEITPQEIAELPSPAAHLTTDDVDLASLLALPEPCPQAAAIASAVAPGLHTAAHSCPQQQPVGYWLEGLEPMELEVTEAASVQAILDRIAANSSGEIAGLMLIEDGTATHPDGSTVTYSNLQVGIVQDAGTVLDFRVEEPGLGGGGLSALEVTDSVQIAELDIPGLLVCSVELRQASGATGGSVYVSRGIGSDQIEYQWREHDVEGVFRTDTACQPI